MGVGDWYVGAQTVLQSEDATYGYLTPLYIAWAPGTWPSRSGLQAALTRVGRGTVLTTEPLELREAYGKLTYLKDYLKGRTEMVTSPDYLAFILDSPS